MIYFLKPHMFIASTINPLYIYNVNISVSISTTRITIYDKRLGNVEGNLHHLPYTYTTSYTGKQLHQDVQCTLVYLSSSIYLSPCMSCSFLYLLTDSYDFFHAIILIVHCPVLSSVFNKCAIVLLK